LSIAVDVDVRPLLHFWGIHPVNASALAADIAAEGLLPSNAILDTLTHYKSILPANNAEFQTYAMNWWGHQPNPLGFWTESEHGRQWDSSEWFVENGDVEQRPNGEIYVEATCADIQSDVDAIIALYFTGGDTDPPTPDPAAFAVPPAADSDTAISMTATTGSDASGPVQYLFTETTGNPGATSSEWQTSPDYTDSDLDASTEYTYTVTMRDALLNTGTASSPANATTQAGSSGVLESEDFEAGMGNWTNVTGDDTDEWYRDSGGTPSNSTGPSSGANGSTWYMFMETSSGYAYSSGDTAILEGPDIGGTNRELTFYYHMYGGNMGTLNVDVYDGSWNNGVWSISGQQHTSNGAAYTQAVVDLSAYSGTIRIRFRGVAAGSWQGDMAVDDIEVTGITGPPDTDPPTPNPATFAVAPAADSSSAISMTATTGSDASGPVEYYFDETSGNPGGTDSGWQTSPSYTDSGLSAETQYTYTVTMRDSLANTGTASSPANATTPVAPANVTILGSWVEGTSHTAESGSGRALIFFAHAEDDNSDMNITSVTYGGQSMTKVVEYNEGSGYRAYAVAFILDEAGIVAASGSTFNVTWAQTPSRTPGYSSVFLGGVDQATPVGASGGNGGTTSTVTTSALATNDGDIVILAGTCGATGSYSVNNGFTEGIEVAVTSGDGVAGYKQATGANETPSITHSAANRQAIVGLVVQVE
jgi:hypothetical protein